MWHSIWLPVNFEAETPLGVSHRYAVTDEARKPKPKKGNQMKNEVETVDATPTWEGLLPLYLMSYENGANEGRRAALEELQRMAQLADAYVASKGGAK